MWVCFIERKYLIFFSSSPPKTADTSHAWELNSSVYVQAVFLFKKKENKLGLISGPTCGTADETHQFIVLLSHFQFWLSCTEAPSLYDRIYPQGPNSSLLSRRANAEGSVGHPNGRVWDCRLCFRVCWQHDHLGVQPQLGSQETKMVFQRRDLCFLYNVTSLAPEAQLQPDCHDHCQLHVLLSVRRPVHTR